MRDNGRKNYEKNKNSFCLIARHDQWKTDLIKAGCPESGIVLDPFMGAGTTALVAAKLNRKYIGFELNADYVKIAEKRLRDELGMFMPNSEPNAQECDATDAK